eukprot:Phypoly_transcript_00879.p2 GENE.Phypoly_transcript_00879~~Phypoly_transcript_00879.p2  ORF type:complete len:486 (+),score=112.78 Phypoly_transcript_00879:2176-3633(+)
MAKNEMNRVAAEAKTKIDGLKDVIEDKSSEYDKISKELNKAKDENRRLNAEISSIKETTTTILNRTKLELANTTNQLFQSQTDLVKTKEQLKKEEEFGKNTVAQLKRTQDELSKTKEQLRSAEETGKVVCAKFNRSQDDLKRSDEAVQKLDVQLARSRDELKRTEDAARNSAAQLVRSQEELSKVKEDLKRTEEASRNTAAQLVRSQEDLAKAREDLKRAEGQVQRLEGEARRLDGEANRVKAENDALRRDIGEATSFLDKQKGNSSYARNIFSMLSSLISSPPQQYEPTGATFSTPQVYTNSPVCVPVSVSPPPSTLATGVTINPPVQRHFIAQKVRSFEVSCFCEKNIADLPDIIEVLNAEGTTTNPRLAFTHEKYDNMQDGGPGMLAVVFAICGTDRVDIVDRELVDNLHEKKGFADVLMVVLRRGSDPTKFKENRDVSINSGVGKEKALIQIIHFKGKVLADADANKANLKKFFDLAVRAF